jgi:hypothetical protein
LAALIGRIRLFFWCSAVASETALLSLAFVTEANTSLLNVGQDGVWSGEPLLC